VRRASQVLIAIAAVEVAAALMLLPWAWGDDRREHFSANSWRPIGALCGNF